jgi:hypothetical protein
VKNRIFLIVLAILTLGLFMPTNIRADDEPEPGVGRISVIRGDVSTMRGDSGTWVASTVNTPVVAGDQVATADRSRAEVQLDYANVLRLDQRTQAKIAYLTRTKIQIQVATGLVDLSVFKGTEAEVEIDTPNMAVHPLTDGVYRIEVDSASQTQLTVREGAVEVSTPQGSAKVEKGQAMQVQGTDNPQYRIDLAQARDDWDKWNSERDQKILEAQAWQHTDRYYTGASDLDSYGQWEYVPGYDWCWTPYVNLGWVPYRSGRWVWEPFWGWTWVSYEPWGWAPYHYGRWFFYGSRWCWWPGRGFHGPRPIWAPAYVSFFGFGGRHWGVGVGFGFGSIGWLPLGPRDTFNPWWGRGRSFNVVNITNVTNITNINNVHPIHGRPGAPAFGSNLRTVLTDPHVRGALTTVSAQNFANGRVTHDFQPVSESMLRSGSMVRGTLPVVPTQASLGARVGNRVGFPSAAVNNEHFFTRSNLPATRTPAFSTEANQIREMAQRGPMANPGQGGQPGKMNLGAGGQAGPAARPGIISQSPMVRSNPTMAERTAPATGQARPQISGQRVGGVASEAPKSGWQRFGPQPAPSAGRTGAVQATPRFTPAPRNLEPRTVSPQGQSSNWQHFTPQPRAYSGAGGAARPFEQGSRGPSGWKAPAPRSGGSAYGRARPPLELNRPIVRQRSGGGGSYGGGSRPSGGHSHSAPRGGGGGGHSSGPHGRR